MDQPLPDTVDADAPTSLPAVAAEPTLAHLTFRLGTHWYAVRVTEVTEVISTPEITPVPGAPALVSGLVQLFGRIVVLLDGAALVQGAAPAPRPAAASNDAERGPRCVVLRAGETPFALSVDEVAGVLEVPASALKATGPIEAGGHIVATLDPMRLLDDAEARLKGTDGWK